VQRAGTGMGRSGGSRGSSGGASLPSLNLRFAERSSDDSAHVVATAGDFTIGSSFVALAALTVRGIKCYFKGGSGRSVKLSLWDAAGTRVDSVTVVTTGDGIITGTFSSSHVISRGAAFTISAYNSALWCKWAFSGTTPSVPLVNTGVATLTRGYLAGPFLQVNLHGCYLSSGGDGFPSTTSDGYAGTCEPVLADIALSA
jgi:hypothetical protein